MSTNGEPLRSSRQTYISIVIANILTLPVAMILMGILSLLKSVEFRVLPIYVVFSAAFVAFGCIPSRSSGWRSIITAMATAVITAAAVIFIYNEITGQQVRPARAWWPYGETMLFIGLYALGLLVFYLISLVEFFFPERSQ